MADILNSFHDTTYKKYLFNHIKNIVGIAKESYQRDLQQKRQRLKELLDAEDLAYENEFRNMVQGRLDEKIRQRKETLLHIHNAKIEQDKEFIARKRAQQLIENSDKIRSILSEKLLKEAKACNLAQIEEKIRRKIEDDNMDMMWLNARDNMLKIDNKYQDFEDKTRREIGLIDQSILLQQMNEQNPKLKEDKIPEYIPGSSGSLFYKRPKEEDLKAIQRQKNIDNQKDLLKYQELRQKLIDESLEAERHFMETINQQIDEEIRKEKEREAIKPKTAEIFLNYCDEIKREKTKELQAENDLIQTQHAEFDCKLVKEHQKYLQDRKNFKLKSHDILLGQLDSQQTKKYNEIILQNEENIVEDELLLRHMKDVENKEAIRKQKCRKYGEELRQQAANHTIDAYQRILKDQEETRKFITETEVEDNIALQLITNDDKALKTHANWRLINCECKKS